MLGRYSLSYDVRCRPGHKFNASFVYGYDFDVPVEIPLGLMLFCRFLLGLFSFGLGLTERKRFHGNYHM